QRLEPPMETPKGRASFASLTGPVSRLLLAMDEAESLDSGQEPCIEQIRPGRYDVIIDVSLNFKPRDGNRRERENEPVDVRKVAKSEIERRVGKECRAGWSPDH